jgi:type IV pilus assembly protein PilW
MNVHRHTALDVREQSGLTLVELLVAMAVGLLLVLAVVSLYLGNKTSFRHQEVNSRLQEDGRFALETIAYDLRNADYTGCGSISIQSNVVTGYATTWWLDSRSMIRGYNSSTGYPVDLTGANTAASDALVVMYRDGESENIIDLHDAAASTFTLERNHAFAQGEILYATDCRRATVFQITNSDSGSNEVKHAYSATPNPGPGNCQIELGSSCDQVPVFPYTFSKGGFVARLVSKAYYIAPATSGSGNALYVHSVTGLPGVPAKFELMPNVQAMRIHYGVDLDCDGTADRYVLAGAMSGLTSDCSIALPSQWNMVVSAKIELLMLSQEINVTTDNQTLCMDYKGTGNPAECTNYNYIFTASNRAAGKVFSTTVTLRNRVT